MTAPSVTCWRHWSGHLRTTRSALLLAYATTLLGVAALPFGILVLLILGQGLFGSRLDVLGWLIDDPSDSPLAVQVLVTLGQLAVATNPPLTSLFSAVTLTQGKPLLFSERVAGQTVTFVAPWLAFTAVHLLAIAFIVWRTACALRRAAR